jgi:homoserine kinase
MRSHVPAVMNRSLVSDNTSPDRHRVVRAYAPGGIGNLGPGLDILGCAVTGLGDIVDARFVDTPGVHLEQAGHQSLPVDPARNAASIAASEVIRKSGGATAGVALRVTKGLPLSGGQGGSAASAVAGAVATNALIGNSLSRLDVLESAYAAERTLSGRHIDNVAPALFGGILLIRSVEPFDFDRLPVPPALRIVLVHPAMQLRTAEARAVLPRSVDLDVAVAQAGAVAAMVAAFCTGDLSRLRGAIDDRIAEPARAPLLPGFDAAKRAALDAGALGCSISGAGPSSFALCDGNDSAEKVCDAMVAAYRNVGIPSSGRVAEVDQRGARLLGDDE